MKALAMQLDAANSRLAERPVPETMPPRNSVCERGDFETELKLTGKLSTDVEWGAFASAQTVLDRDAGSGLGQSMTMAEVDKLIAEIEGEQVSTGNGSPIIVPPPPSTSGIEGRVKPDRVNALESGAPVPEFEPVLEKVDATLIDISFRLQLLARLLSEKNGYMAEANKRHVGWLLTSSQRDSQVKAFKEIITTESITVKSIMGLELTRCLNGFKLPKSSKLNIAIQDMISECCSSEQPPHKEKKYR